MEMQSRRYWFAKGTRELATFDPSTHRPQIGYRYVHYNSIRMKLLNWMQCCWMKDLPISRCVSGYLVLHIPCLIFTGQQTWVNALVPCVTYSMPCFYRIANPVHSCKSTAAMEYYDMMKWVIPWWPWYCVPWQNATSTLQCTARDTWRRWVLTQHQTWPSSVETTLRVHSLYRYCSQLYWMEYTSVS